MFTLHNYLVMHICTVDFCTVMHFMQTSYGVETFCDKAIT